MPGKALYNINDFFTYFYINNERARAVCMALKERI